MNPPPVPKNPPPLPAGMDNPWYDYSPYPKRPLLAWPTEETVIDFGSPERLEQASEWVASRAEA